MSVPSLSASSTFSAPIFAVSAATKRSWIPCCTTNRLDAVQRWPVEKNALCSATFTAVSRSASSSTTCGFLPPISSCTFASRAAHCCATRLPTSTEPVKLIASTSGVVARISPTTEPRPITRLNTPFGMPLREMISASAHAQPGTRSAGLNTTQLP